MSRLLQWIDFGRLTNAYAANIVTSVVLIILIESTDFFPQSWGHWSTVIRIIMMIGLLFGTLYWVSVGTVPPEYVRVQVAAYSRISEEMSFLVRKGVVMLDDTELVMPADLDFAVLGVDLQENLIEECSRIAEAIQSAVEDACKSAGLSVETDDRTVRITVMMPTTISDPQSLFRSERSFLAFVGNSYPTAFTWEQGVGFPMGSGLAGICWRERSPQLGGPLTDDGLRDARWMDLPSLLWDDHSVYSLASVPIFDTHTPSVLLAVLNLSVSFPGLLPRHQEFADDVANSLFLPALALSVAIRKTLTP